MDYWPCTLSTAADYVWFLDIPQHQVLSGSIHGAVLFAALGAYLGWRKGKAAIGLIGPRAKEFLMDKGYSPDFGAPIFATSPIA